MEYVYAALLLHKLKQDVTEDNIKNVIKATGASPDEVRVKALVAALGDVNIDDALKASVTLSAPSATSTSPAPTSEASSTTKEEEKKEEKKEEEALEGLSSLFG
jgi:large subunit ribosomal protein L12